MAVVGEMSLTNHLCSAYICSWFDHITRDTIRIK